MRTTKVKRLWPVLALAPLFALAAILGVSLWHSGPTALTPPAAEAQGRGIGTVDLTPAGNTCTVTRNQDSRCISNGNMLTVRVVAGIDAGGPTPIPANENVAAYVTGAGDETINVAGPHRTYPNMRAKDGESPPNPLGKRGIGSFLLAATGTTGDSIEVKRSWADNDGKVWVFIDADGDTPVITGTDVPMNSDGTDGLVEIFFTQAIDTSVSVITELVGDTGLPAKRETEGTPTERAFKIADADGDGATDTASAIRFNVNPRAAPIDDQAISLGGRIIVSHEFTAGSALEDDIEMTGTETHPDADDPVVAPALADDGLVPADEPTGIQLSGWKATGPVELTVNVTHIAGTGERTAFDPFTLYREGPAHAIVFAMDGGLPPEPHRTTDGTTYEGIGPLEINDVLGRTATVPSLLIYEGDDAEAAAILPEAESARTLTYGQATDARFNITIKDTAATGEYNVNFVAKGPEGDDGMRPTLATLGVTVDVIGAPDAMAGTVASNLVEPGDNVQLTGVALTSGGENAFDPPCEGATGTSICTWTAKDAATQAVLASRSGPVGTDGTASIGVKSTAAPGTYTIVLSDTRTQGVAAPDRATSREVSFTVVGRPATYTLTGPDRIAAGQIGAYMVTAKDANGNLPYFPTDEPTAADVSIVVSGTGAASVTPLRLSEGKVRLNARGEASFQVRVNNDAPSGSITIDAVGLGDGLASKTVTIGPEALGAPTGLRLGTMSDDTGTVTLSWTAGANSTKHWIAGIKQEDWDANDFSNVLWTAPDANTMHTFSGLDGGKVYVFTVAAGNAADQWSAWAPLQRITVGVPAPTGGGGPANPFGN